MSDTQENIYTVHHGWVADSDKVVLSSFDHKIFRFENISLDQILIFRNIFYESSVQ